jgi:hypothetical protein
MESQSSESKKEDERRKPGIVIWSTNTDVFNQTKITELKHRILESDSKPDIIAVSEVRSKNKGIETDSNIYSLDGYEKECLNTTGSEGRGMILYVRSALKHDFKDISVYSEPIEEVQMVEVYLKNKQTLCVCSVYRSPNSSPCNNAKINSFLQLLSNKKYTHLVVTGDFNYRHIDWISERCLSGENTEDFKFMETIRDCFMKQHVLEPTRGRGSDRPSLLDLVLTNDENAGLVCVESPLGKSDHALIKTFISCEVVLEEGNRPRRLYNKGDYKKMNEMLKGDWKSKLQHANVQEQWDIFTKCVDQAIEECIPLSKQSNNLQRHKTMLDKKSLSKIKRKNRLWRKYTQTGDSQVYKEYCQVRNQVRRITRKSQKNAERLLAEDVKHNPKKFWKYVGGKTKSKSKIPNLSQNESPNESMTTNDHEKAEALAKFFTSVFTLEPDGQWNLPEMLTPDHDIEMDVSATAIRKVLDSINISKSPGPDGIQSRILYETREVICEPLSIIFATSLESGALPKEWKEANITAIHKKGKKSLCGNYRPVSLTSTVCKIMETLIRTSLVTFMQKNDYFTSQQFGFISGRSTVLQLIQVLDEWTKILDSGGCVDTVYCDFMKAFDTVPHGRLGQMLQHYGVKGPVLSWIKDFLRDRRQRVIVNGAKSEWHAVLSGIPQGSVLGPVLFVIYINTLPSTAEFSKIFLFADDTKILKEVKEQEDCDKLQKDLDNMYEWTQQSLLKFHPDKCVSMRIGKTKLEETVYTMGPQKAPLRRSSVEKDIGVFIDDKLNFDEHINNKVNKANSMMGIIRRSFEFLNEQTFKLLYKALVRPHLEYANQVWSPALKRQEIMVENVQRRATKLIPGYKELSYEDRLRKLGIPTLKYRRARGDMIELYKILTGKYDKKVSDFIPLSKVEKGTRGHNYKIEKQPFRLNVRKNSFVCRSTDIWNKLPANIVNAPSTQAFESRLDKHWATEPFRFNCDEQLNTPQYGKPTEEDIPLLQPDGGGADPTPLQTRNLRGADARGQDGLQSDNVM